MLMVMLRRLLERLRGAPTCADDNGQSTGPVAAAALVAAIARGLPDIKCGSLVVFGDIFGGRIDNFHQIVAAELAADGSALIRFDLGETLQIWDPGGLTVGPTTFRVRRAAHVRWDWFAYGREMIPENRCFIDHVLEGGKVRATTDVDWVPLRFSPRRGLPAVELVGYDPVLRDR